MSYKEIRGTSLYKYCFANFANFATTHAKSEFSVADGKMVRFLEEFVGFQTVLFESKRGDVQNGGKTEKSDFANFANFATLAEPIKVGKKSTFLHFGGSMCPLGVSVRCHFE